LQAVKLPEARQPLLPSSKIDGADVPQKTGVSGAADRFAEAAQGVVALR
jgi:hypothetical protein